MSRQLHSELTHDWKEIVTKLSKTWGVINDLEMELLLELPDTPDAKELAALTDVCDRLTKSKEAISGLSYLCTPQSEWTGGEGSVERVPHLVNEAKP